MRNGLATGVWAVSVLVLSGCQFFRNGSPYVSPTVPVEVKLFSGSPMSGPTSVPVAIKDPAGISGIEIRVIALEDRPAEWGEPLESRARLIIATRGNEPVLSDARLTRTVRIVQTAELEKAIGEGRAGRWAELTSFRGAVAPGTTVRLAVNCGGIVQRAGVVVHRPAAPGAGNLVGSVVEGPYEAGPAAGLEDGPDTHPPTPQTICEHALLDRDAVGTTAFVMPVRFGPPATQGIAFIVSVFPGDDSPGHAESVAVLAREVGQSIATAGRRPPLLKVVPEETAALQVALSDVKTPTRRRAAMTWLAVQTRARLFEDAAMIGDEDALRQLAERISKRAGEAGVARSGDELGWLLDRAAFEFLGDQVIASKIAPEFASIMVAFAGEAGRNAGSIEEVKKGLATRRDFDARLAAENLMFLEDNSPSARVRAYDWLAARNLAPAGYDPLGDPRERRAALDKHQVPAGGAKP